MVTEHEKEMENFMPEYDCIAKNARDICIKNIENYDKRISIIKKMLYGFQSFVTMLFLRVERLVSLGYLIKDEDKLIQYYDKLIDTVLDLANYAIYLGIYLNRKKNKE